MGLSLFLMRHEEAEPGFYVPDAHRALTGFGRARMRRTAALFAEQEGTVDVVFTSPLVRAVQTTEILVAALAHDEPVVARGVVAEPASVEHFLGLLEDLNASHQKVVIVGHEPTMSYVSAHLLGLDRFPRSFSTGMLLALDHERGTTSATFRYLIDGDGPQLLTELDG